MPASRLFVTTGADKSVWSPTDGIWEHVVDDDIEISVTGNGNRYRIAGEDAESFSDAEEASGADGKSGLSPLSVGGGPQISWMDAPEHLGETVTVTGQIVAVRVLKNIAFLNFSSQYWRDLTVVIFSDNFGNFPADLRATYLKRNVQVRGQINLFEGRPQIVIETSSQIGVQ